MKRWTILASILVCWAIVPCNIAHADKTDDLLGQIDRMATAGEKSDHSLGESIADGIEEHPVEVAKSLRSKLQASNLTEQQLTVYVWALGLTKDRAAETSIEAVYRQHKSDVVRRNCLRALANIGGTQAGEFLLSAMDAELDKEKRFDILNSLGQMQFAAALPKAEEVLKQDPREFYWQSIFVFGKMGDKAVPFLLTKISDADRNVRANAINVLGQWLIPPEGATPLLDQFWKEQDAELREMILGSLERTIADLKQMKTVFEEIVAKEKDAELTRFARETLANIDRMKADSADFAKKKQPSAASFQREYADLFKSAGKKGSYEVLGMSSMAQDEAKLKALRERILQRDSDEAFYDYQKVNEIVIRNRMMKQTSAQLSPVSSEKR
jgi:hypothetical protein